MKEYIIYGGFAELEILTTGVIKPDFFIRKTIFKFLFKNQVLNGQKQTIQRPYFLPRYFSKNTCRPTKFLNIRR